MQKKHENIIQPSHFADPFSIDFLRSGSGVPNKGILQIGNIQMGEKDCKATGPVLSSIQTLTMTELRKKYSLEYSRWSNMKQRCKKGKATLDPRFSIFKTFLAHMGAIPSKQFTLDRINNNDKTYSPENCRWADKKTQNSNKGNNIFLKYKDETHTIADWAKLTNQNASTLYKRHDSGWTDEETITGNKISSADPITSGTCWPKQKWEWWERKYQQHLSGSHSYVSRVHFLHDASRNLANFYKAKGRTIAEEANPQEVDHKLNLQAEVFRLRAEMLTDFYLLTRIYVLHKEKMDGYLNKFSGAKEIEKKRFLVLHPYPLTIDELSKKLTVIQSSFQAKLEESKKADGEQSN